MKKLISLACLAACFSLAATQVPAYVTQLYAAVHVQAESSLPCKAASLLKSNNYYKAQLAERTAIIAAQEAGEATISGVYAKALQIADIEDQSATTHLLKQRYEAALQEEQNNKNSFIAGAFWVGAGAATIFGLSIVAKVLYREVKRKYRLRKQKERERYLEQQRNREREQWEQFNPPDNEQSESEMAMRGGSAQPRSPHTTSANPRLYSAAFSSSSARSFDVDRNNGREMRPPSSSSIGSDRRFNPGARGYNDLPPSASSASSSPHPSVANEIP